MIKRCGNLHSLSFFSLNKKMKNKIHKDKGTAGLTILLSVVVMLFVIGLIVMIFNLMGSGLQDATYDVTSATVTNESTGYYLNGTTYTVDNAGALGFTAFTVTALHNASDGAVIGTGNVTAGTTGTIVNASADWEGTYEVNVSYTYTYDATNTATDTMNDTRTSVAGVTDWFDIFIVITAMVVLILLTVIIITAIRSSGMVSGVGGSGNIGTA